MRAAMLVGCAALLLSACSSEPVQQATAAHVTPGMRAAMSDAGQANCRTANAAASRRWRAAAAATNGGPIAGQRQRHLKAG